MAFKMSEQFKREALNSMGGVLQADGTGRIPYDTITLRMENGVLHIDFDQGGETMFTIRPVQGWEMAESFSIGGVDGALTVTVKD